MKIDDLFENMHPVATVWKKRGDKIERGRISKFMVDLAPLKKLEVDREKGKEEAQPDGSSAGQSGVSSAKGEVGN